MTRTELSRFIALILRHRPEVIGIALDAHGWANVDELIAGISKTHPLTRETLEAIVASDEKQRYAFNENKTFIRANQGHSIPVDLELKAIEPPRILYHGTGEKFVASIEKQGLRAKSRLYVHLSEDGETALKVGARHGKPVIFCVIAKEMHRDGYAFYRSLNGVWLTREVPGLYLKRMEHRDPREA